MNSPQSPSVSVIIPTHNRREGLPRTLAALARQTCPMEQLEVVVVADGCVDGTAEFLHTCTTPFPLQVLEQGGLGPAAARNSGAKAASGQILIFLDDDIEATPGLVVAHMAAHQQLQTIHSYQLTCHGSVVSGHLPLQTSAQAGYFERNLQAWWDGKFFKMRQPGYRFGYDDLFSGNFSVSAEFFRQVGGFNTNLRCHEDYELGLRLLAAGAVFAFAEEAVGIHHDITNAARAMSRRQAEGQADVYLVQRYPELAERLPMNTGTYTLLGRVMRWLAFSAPVVGDGIAAILFGLLPILEKIWFYLGWLFVFYHLHDYWYWRAVAAEVKSPDVINRLFADLKKRKPALPQLEIDLAVGLKTAEIQLNQHRPASVRLRMGTQIVADIPAEIGKEWLHGGHLRQLLGTMLAGQTAVSLQMARFAGGEGQPETPQTDASQDTKTKLTAWRHQPKKVAEVELSQGITAIDTTGYADLYLLVKYQSKPFGFVTLVDLDKPLVTAETVRQTITKQLGYDIAAQISTHENRKPGIIQDGQLPVSVVVCTRDRTAQLRDCLQALQTLDYASYEIVVVDNAPSSEETRQLVVEMASSNNSWLPNLRYVHEARPGLDWARNRGIAEAQHDIVAFTDDDARPDKNWLKAITRAFAEPEVMAVTGSVVPAELDTPAQSLFEFGYGGMGHGFRRQFFRRADLAPERLLWASAFGVGANMAFRKELFARIGGFDVALDVGTVSGGGGDVEMFHRVVAKGHTLVYEPDALVWHYHRREDAALTRLVYQNGRSFVCYLLTCGRNGTVGWWPILNFTLRSWLWGWLGKRLFWPKGFPRHLIWSELKGALSGPWAYLSTRRYARQIHTRFGVTETLLSHIEQGIPNG